MHVRQRLSLFLLPFSLSLGPLAWASPEYRVTVVAPANSSASDINQAGVVVGHYPFSAIADHGFLNRGRGLVDLGALRGSSSEAVAINDKGQVLGHWITAGGERRGFIYYRGSAHDIGIAPGGSSRYTDINNRGYITVNGSAPDTFAPRGFLRAPDGSFRDIGSLPVDDPITEAYALNNHQQISGASGPLTFPEQPWRAIVWQRGVMRDLGDLGFAPNYAIAINDCGQVTGSASLAVGLHNRKAFLYTHGRLVDIDGRPDGVERSSQGTGINNHGYVVGTSDHLSGFLYRGRHMQSLNALIDSRAGWDIQTPVAINDAGQIAATARRNGVLYAVRLDLIRPLAAQAPLWDMQEMVAPEVPSAEEAQADADAEAREVVQPVPQ
jgi:probable HAF family extracellular repeat protein